MANKKSIPIWVTKDKAGNMQMFTSKPIKGDQCWYGDFYVNSMIYQHIKPMIDQSTMTFDSEPEFLELSISKQI